jgi:hypothetical protein
MYVPGREGALIVAGVARSWGLDCRCGRAIEEAAAGVDWPALDRDESGRHAAVVAAARVAAPASSALLLKVLKADMLIPPDLLEVAFCDLDLLIRRLGPGRLGVVQHADVATVSPLTEDRAGWKNRRTRHVPSSPRSKSAAGCPTGSIETPARLGRHSGVTVGA